MKKILLFLFLVAFAKMNAQCTSDPVPMSHGAYPDSLSASCVNALYSDTTTLVFKVDSVIFGFTIPLDSVLITGVTHLAPGLAFSCGNGTCKTISQLPAPMRNCVLIDGIPTSATGPNDSVVVHFTFWVTIPFVGAQSFADSFAVDLTIDICTNTSGFSSARPKMYPNPTQDQLTIEMPSGQNNSTTAVRIYTVTGLLISEQSVTGSSAIIATDGFAEGVYFVTIESAGEISSERLIIQR